jgi:NAD-dependent dihydropyrimidine dehydrogenase PreA subunit
MRISSSEANEAMPYVITETCVGTCDTACVEVCPCDCIHGPLPLDEVRKIPKEERSRRLPSIQLYIDPSDCIDCGACEPVCPVSAIFLDDELPNQWAHCRETNAAFFRR